MQCCPGICGAPGTSYLTDTFCAACRVAAQCGRRIMLTGTPLQNDLGELQNLLAFLLPDLFKEEAALQPGDVQAGVPQPAFPWSGASGCCMPQL